MLKYGAKHVSKLDQNFALESKNLFSGHQTLRSRHPLHARCRLHNQIRSILLGKRHVSHLHSIPRNFRRHKHESVGSGRQQFDPNGCHHHHDNSAHYALQKALLSNHSRMAHHVLVYAAFSLFLSLFGATFEGSQHSNGLSDCALYDVEFRCGRNDCDSLASAFEAPASLYDFCKRIDGFGFCEIFAGVHDLGESFFLLILR